MIFPAVRLMYLPNFFVLRLSDSTFKFRVYTGTVKYIFEFDIDIQILLVWIIGSTYCYREGEILKQK